jgi:hypothetical protein
MIAAAMRTLLYRRVLLAVPRCRDMVAGSDVTQPWPYQREAPSKIRVYGRVSRGGIKLNSPVMTARWGVPLEVRRGDWLTSVHPPAPMQRLQNIRRLPHSLSNKPPQVTFKPPAPFYVRAQILTHLVLSSWRRPRKSIPYGMTSIGKHKRSTSATCTM